MKQIDKMTKDNWKDMGKVTKDLQRVTIRWKNSVVGNFGKSHPASKRAMALLKRVMKLKSELDDLVYDHAGYLFPDDSEISSIFYGDYEGKTGKDRPQSE